MYNEIISYIKKLFDDKDSIPLHVPIFIGNEKKYVSDCIERNYVSSIGTYVDHFENVTAKFTGAKYGIACVNGTEALHVSLILSGVTAEDEVLTQPLTFVATANAITYTGAHPVFIDVDLDTLSLSPANLKKFLEEFADIRDDGYCYNKLTNRCIKACVPMHTFGHPCKMDELQQICQNFNITLIEDAAEALGSFYKDKHCGTFGKLGVLSFNGNKIITTGGGGMILSNDIDLAKRAKHLTTQAKISHPWEYIHDKIGYNYRMPNINAAIGVAQMENLENYISNKRELARYYKRYFDEIGIQFIYEPNNCRSNYWLNAILFNNYKERNEFLEYSNKCGVSTRPIWQLLTELPMYATCQSYNIENAKWIRDRVVNIPSSVRLKNGQI